MEEKKNSALRHPHSLPALPGWTSYTEVLSLGVAHMMSTSVGCSAKNAQSKLHSDIKYDIAHGHLRV